MGADPNEATEFAGGPQLLWTKPDWRTLRYELHHDGQLVATLGFRSATGSFATAESGDGCWTFKRIGFLQTRATVRRCGGNDDVGTFNNGLWTSGGILVLPDGRRYRADMNLCSNQRHGASPPALLLHSARYFSAGRGILTEAERVQHLVDDNRS